MLLFGLHTDTHNAIFQTACVPGPGRNGPSCPWRSGFGGLWRVKLVWGPAAAACVALMNRTWCRPLIFCPARGWSLALNGGPLLYKELRFPTIVRAAAPAARERGQGGKHRCRPDTTRCQRHETVMQIAGPFVCVCTGVCMFTDGGCTPPDHLN